MGLIVFKSEYQTLLWASIRSLADKTKMADSPATIVFYFLFFIFLFLFFFSFLQNSINNLHYLCKGYFFIEMCSFVQALLNKKTLLFH